MSPRPSPKPQTRKIGDGYVSSMKEDKMTKKLKLSEDNNSVEELSDSIYTISQLNERIKEILKGSFKDNVWICGEVYRYNLKSVNASGYVYFQLIEQDIKTKNIKASIPVIIWAGKRQYIENKLIEFANDFQLKDGLEIKVQGYIDFYSPQGKVSFIINDIDVEHTVGKIALKRKQLIEKLRKSGLLDKNKQIPMPLVPLRIGLITSEVSAGYNDFINELQGSGYGFSVYLCDARVQGDKLEEDMLYSIANLNKTDADVIVIVRGGGSASDLMGFDNENVAIAIAKSSKPVLTGIGHQIDNTVADEVANMSLKTPTAVAKFLIEKVQEYDNEMENIFQQIFNKQGEIIEHFKENINAIAGTIKTNTLRFLERNEEKLRGFSDSFKINSRNFISHTKQNFLNLTDGIKLSVRLITERNQQKILYINNNLVRILEGLFKTYYISLNNCVNQISLVRLNRLLVRQQQKISQTASQIVKRLSAFIIQENKQLDNWEMQKNLKDPQNIIKKGYSLIYTATSEILKNIDQVNAGDNIRAILSDGQIAGTVNSKNRKEE